MRLIIGELPIVYIGRGCGIRTGTPWQVLIDEGPDTRKPRGNRGFLDLVNFRMLRMHPDYRPSKTCLSVSVRSPETAHISGFAATHLPSQAH